MGEVMDSNHVPFKFPTRPYSLSQEWLNLTFIHWKVDEELLRKHIPKELEIGQIQWWLLCWTCTICYEKCAA